MNKCKDYEDSKIVETIILKDIVIVTCEYSADLLSADTISVVGDMGKLTLSSDCFEIPTPCYLFTEKPTINVGLKTSLEDFINEVGNILFIKKEN